MRCDVKREAYLVPDGDVSCFGFEVFGFCTT